MTAPLKDARGVVLAGGRSRRFGTTDKLRADLGDRSLLEHVCRAVGAATDRPPIVAVRSAEQRAALQQTLDLGDAAFVTDAAEYRGPLAGIAAAIPTVDAEWTVLCAGDMPALSPTALERLADAAAGEQASPAAVLPVDEGGAHPLHALYRTGSLDEAVAERSADDSVRSLLESTTPTVEVSTEGRPDLARSVRNVNTVADLERLREAVEAERSRG